MNSQLTSIGGKYETAFATVSILSDSKYFSLSFLIQNKKVSRSSLIQMIVEDHGC